MVNAHYKRGNAKGAVNGPPPVTREIENDEDVSRKQWYIRASQFPSMSNGSSKSGSETAEAEVLKVETRPIFAMRDRSRDEPAFRFLQIEVRSNACKMFHQSFQQVTLVRSPLNVARCSMCAMNHRCVTVALSAPNRSIIIIVNYLKLNTTKFIVRQIAMLPHFG